MDTKPLDGCSFEDLFADFVVRHDPRALEDFEPLFASHPAVAPQLQALAEDWARLDHAHEAAFGVAPGLGRSIRHESLFERVGKGAQAIYARYLLDRQRGKPVEFEQLKGQHPGVAGELGQLDAHWKRIEAVFSALGQASRLDSAFFVRNAKLALEGGLEGSAQTRELIRTLLSRRTPTGRYQLNRELGAGGMGRVLEVTDPSLRRRLAMKVIKDPSIDLGREFESGEISDKVARFLEEAQVTGQLDHPSIVPIHELGVDDQGHPYFTMKRVHGEEFSKVFERVWAGDAEWPLSRAVDLMLRVGEALTFAHAKRVIHRDLKPANVMVGRYGEVYVMDWGLAKVLGGDKRPTASPAESPALSLIQTDRADQGQKQPGLLSQAGSIKGTPAYMSPEQAHGADGSDTVQLDIYALGAMFYHLLAGHPPYHDETADNEKQGAPLSPQQILLKIAAGPPCPLAVNRQRQHAPELLAIVGKAMERDPRDRYLTMAELVNDLRAFQERRVVKAYRTGPVAELRKWVERNRTTAASGILTIASVVFALILLSGSLRSRAQTAETGLEQANEQLDSLHKQAEEQQQKLDALDSQLGEKQEELDSIQTLKRTLEVDLGRARTDKQAAESELLDVQAQRSKAQAEAVREQQRLDRLSMERRLVDLLESGEQLLPIDGGSIAAAHAWLVECGLVAALVDKEANSDPAPGKATGQTSPAGGSTGPPQASDLGDQIAELVYLIQGLEQETQQVIAWRQAVHESQRAPWDRRLATMASRSQEAGSHLEELKAQAIERKNEASTLQNNRDLWIEDREAHIRTLARSLLDPLTGLRARVALAILTYEQAAELSTSADSAWQECLQDLRNPERFPLYAGLELSPVPGLVPIGPIDTLTPDRKGSNRLYQFWHVASGKRPEFDTEGNYLFDRQDGLVLLLIPGGAFSPGSPTLAADDPAAHVQDNEQPSLQADARLQFNPFFLARFELAAGQWARLRGALDPAAAMDPLRPDLPATEITWNDADSTLRVFGLGLPSEAQWEWACRAGSQTQWWWGDHKPDTMRDELINLWGMEAPIEGFPHYRGPYTSVHKDHDAGPAPIQLRAASHPWGLVHISGNVAEWCLDSYEQSYSYAQPRPGDGARLTQTGTERVYRGGSFESGLDACRSSSRRRLNQSQSDFDVGLRPVLRISGLGR